MRFPVIFQHSDSDCGPANIRAIARHHGVELRNETVRRICRNDRSGTSLAGLRRAFEHLGFAATARTIDLDELRRYQRALLPAVAVIKNPGTGLLHYVTVVRIGRSKVSIMDPAHGLLSWSHPEFLSRWQRFEHEVSLEKFREGNRDPENLATARADLAALGVPAGRIETLLTRLPLLDLDDRIRYVRSLASQGLLKGLESAARYLERLVEHPEQFPLPAEFVTLERRPDPGGYRLVNRGFLLLTVRPGPAISRFHEPGPHPVRRLLGLIGAERKLVTEILLAALAVAALGLTLPLFLQLLVDTLLVQRDPAVLLYFVAGFALLSFCRDAFNFYRAWLLIRLSQKIDLFLILQYVAKLARLKIRFFELRTIGDLTSRIQETFAIRTFVAGAALQVLFDLLFVGVALTAMFAYDWRLALIALGAVPVYYAILHLGGPLLRDAARKQMEDWAASNALLIETIEGMKTIKLNASERTVFAALDARLAKWSRSTVRQALTANWVGAAGVLTALLTNTLMLYFGSLAVTAGRITIGQLLAIHAMVIQMIGGLSGLVRANDDIQRARATVERRFEILDGGEEEKDRDHVLPERELRGELAIEGVSFAYLEGAPVLEEINCRIRPGEEVVVVGQSGAGKSTLIGLLARLYDPDRGTIRLDDHDLKDYALSDLRRQLAVVAQDTHLFADTVYNNIAHARPASTLDEVTAAARAAQAEEFIRALPEKFESVVGERGVGLSGGQAKRLLIARALLTRPSVLILDEAYNGLDATVQTAVKAGVREWMKGRTVIHITHDLRHAREADRVLVLDGGRLVEQGTHAELVAREGLYGKLYADYAQETKRPAPGALS